MDPLDPNVQKGLAKIREAVRNTDPDDVFNMDETGIFHTISLFNDCHRAVQVQCSSVGTCSRSVVIQMSVHLVSTNCKFKKFLFGIVYQYRQCIAGTAGLPQSTMQIKS